MNLEKTLNRLQRGLDIRSGPEFGSSVHWTPSENLPVHRWFRYREAFSPSLLDRFPTDQRRLDPFCGCGTTLLQSARQGAQSYGVDLSPLATFVANVKTQNYNHRDKVVFRRLSLDATNSYKTCRPAPQPAYPLLKKLFLPESLETLLKLRAFVDSVTPRKQRDLLFLAWLSILEDASNTFKEGNGLKYRNKRRRPGQYVTIPDREWIPRYFGSDVQKFVAHLWISKCSQIEEDIDLLRFSPRFTPTIRTASCLEPEAVDFDVPFDLVIFSPPYANRFDYFEAFKIELWLGGFVKCQEDMLALRHKSVRNNLAAARFKSGANWPLLRPFLDAMDERASSVRMGIKNALQGYFFDMRTLLRNLKKVLTKRGKVVIIVGNSAYAKSIVPTDLLTARLGEEEGYRVKQIHIARPLHVSSQQRAALSQLENFMRESIVVFEKV